MRRSGRFTGDNEASESEKLKIHLPIVSQLFNFWSANKRASSAAPRRRQALSELGLSRAQSPEREDHGDDDFTFVRLHTHSAPSLTDSGPYADLSTCVDHISARVQ